MTAGQKMTILVAIPADLENQDLVDPGIMFAKRSTQDLTVWSKKAKILIMT